MEYKQLGSEFLLRLNPHEELITAILAVAKREQILLARISGIGAASQIDAGIFLPVEKTYENKLFTGIYELTSLTGNITNKEGEPFLHLHGSWSDTAGNGFGGHLNAALISVTAEVFITPLKGSVYRRFSEEIGLNRIEFEPIESL